MAYIGFEIDGKRQIGQLHGENVVPLGDIDSFYANPAAASPKGEPVALANLTVVPFVPLTSRIFCVGINYHSHAAESKAAAGLDVPKFPMIFGRWEQSLVVDGTPVPVPPNEVGLDWEVELAVVIGKKGWLIPEERAMDHVLGFTVFNDLSARKKQLETPQFTLGKNADFSGPIGPVLKTAAEVGDVRNLKVQSRFNGEVMQEANTGDLIHTIERIIAYITDTVTLLPGDVIATGTPGGVGLGQNPPRYLQPGDTVEVEIENIGILRNPIISRSDLKG